MTLAVIMKITSSTRTTSTSGTTLMSDMAAGPPNRRPRLPPSLNEKATLTAEIPLCEVLKLDGEIFHARAHLLDARAEYVVEDRRWNGGCQADCGGHQRFRNAGSNGPQAGASGVAEPLKRIDDAPNRSEQADKRRRGRHRGEPVHIHLELRYLFTSAEL